jgi:hypothetical protein
MAGAQPSVGRWDEAAATSRRAFEAYEALGDGDAVGRISADAALMEVDYRGVRGQAGGKSRIAGVWGSQEQVGRQGAHHCAGGEGAEIADPAQVPRVGRLVVQAASEADGNGVSLLESRRGFHDQARVTEISWLAGSSHGEHDYCEGYGGGGTEDTDRLAHPYSFGDGQRSSGCTVK